MKGARSEGVAWWRDLGMSVWVLIRRTKGIGVPQHNAAILGAPPGMFPCLPRQFCVGGAPRLSIHRSVGSSQPSVDDETRPGIESKGLGRCVDRMEGVQQGGCRDLGGVLAIGSNPSWGGGARVRRHPISSHDGCSRYQRRSWVLAIGVEQRIRVVVSTKVILPRCPTGSFSNECEGYRHNQRRR